MFNPSNNLENGFRIENSRLRLTLALPIKKFVVMHFYDTIQSEFGSPIRSDPMREDSTLSLFQSVQMNFNFKITISPTNQPKMCTEINYTVRLVRVMVLVTAPLHLRSLSPIPHHSVYPCTEHLLH